MSLFTGYMPKYLTTERYDTKTSGGLDMNFFPLRNICSPTEPFDAISQDYFKKNIVTQTILYKYLGFSNFGVKHLPTYNHGNSRGSDILHSENYNESSVLHLHHIIFDSDSTNYNIRLHFYARLIYKDKTIVDKKLTTGNGLNLVPKEQYDIELERAGNKYNVKWIDLTLSKKLKDISKKPLSKLRFIIILVEQSYGVTGGQEFVVNCSVKG